MIYTACVGDEERIEFFGQGETPDKALKDFISEALNEYCEYYGIESGEKIEVEIYETKYADGWDEEESAIAEVEGFKWFLGQRVEIHEQLYKPN